MTATINTLNFSDVTALIGLHLLLLDSQPWLWLFFCVTHFIRITERRLLPILLYSSGFNDFDRSRRFVICRFHHITEWQFRSVPFFHAIHWSLSFYSIVAVLLLVRSLSLHINHNDNAAFLSRTPSYTYFILQFVAIFLFLSIGMYDGFLQFCWTLVSWIWGLRVC